MAFPSHIFRSYDIRGLLPEVTTELAERVGGALVAQTKAKTVVVGRDMRATSPELAAAAIRGATEAGARVLDIGMCTTSTFNFAVTTLAGADIGMMITASHNPAEYNGIKVAYASGSPISGKELAKMVELVPEKAEVVGEMETRDVREEYLARCIELAGSLSLSGVKIVVDYGNGMGSTTVRDLLTRLGATLVELYPEPDARFPNHEANPAKEETLTDLKAAIVREGAALGIALDGDVDRLKLIDNTGTSIPSDHLLALLSQELLREQAGAKVVVTMNMSWATSDAIKNAGGEVVETPIGRTNVIKAMIEQGAILGGEVSGHVMFKDFAYLEAVDYAIVRALALWHRSGKSLAELVAPLRTYFNSGEVNLEVHDKETALTRVRETYFPEASQTSTADGVRAIFGTDWWFILRPSNTEPVVRLTVEARSTHMMEEKRDEILSLLAK